MGLNLEDRVWWDYLEEDLQELLKESTLLVARTDTWAQKFHDYSFVVFPAAKAYEGFLKKLFLDMEFITKDDYYGKRFRIGKALNPSLDRRFRRKQGVYDKLVNYCGGKDLADGMWLTWKECRNTLFHWFPDEKNVVSLQEAKQKVVLVLNTMDAAYKDCKINSINK